MDATYMTYPALPDPFDRPEFYETIRIKRLIAWGIDLVVTLTLSVVLSILTFGLGFLLFFLVLPLVSFAYRYFTLSGSSATWGMRMMAIQLREGDGQRLRASTAFWHTLGYHLSFMLPVVQMASVAMMAFSTYRQGLSDMVFDTVMINTPRERY